MFFPFDTAKAQQILLLALKSLKSGELILEQQSRISQERSSNSVMLGACVCIDGNGREHNLIAVSGNAKCLKFYGTSDSQNFEIVPSIVNGDQIEQALSQNDWEIHQLTDRIRELKLSSQAEDTVSDLKLKLSRLCSQSLEKVYSLYSFNCIDGTKKSLKEICGLYNKNKLPPTGTGDCCEPKLLHYAFEQNLRPVSMAQTKCNPDLAQNTAPLALIEPCDERCGILLPAMLGLRILYRDEHIIVVNKQSGLLSVPGRGPDKQDCIVNRFKRLFPQAIEQPAVHRLDMETSGIMILAFTKEAHKNLNMQFENKMVQKEYVALLDGVLARKRIASHGTMELFFRLDVDNRPHQIWDEVNGKSAVTEWEILGVERYKAPDGTVRNATRVLFKPHTGRTHQLRLASSDSHGFGVPIIGDTLYGKCAEGERLMLHAKKIRFTHPATGLEVEIECESEF